MHRIIIPFYCFLFFLAAFSVRSNAQERADTQREGLIIKIRQTVFPENFTKKQLRVYRLEKGRLHILIEGFNDPEAEINIKQKLTEESMELLRQAIERGRIMSNFIDCRVYTPASDTRLKTEMIVVYRGETKICYSFDKGFSNELNDLLAALNQIIPEEEYRVEIPRDNLNWLD